MMIRVPEDIQIETSRKKEVKPTVVEVQVKGPKYPALKQLGGTRQKNDDGEY